MATPEDLDEAIEQAELEPLEVTDDRGRTIRHRSLEELRAHKAAQSTAKAKNHFGLRFTKLQPPGCQ